MRERQPCPGVNECNRLFTPVAPFGAYDNALMYDTPRNAVAEMKCTRCGSRADDGLIFCKQCGAALRTPTPLIQSAIQADTPTPVPTLLTFFSICAVVDFVFGLEKWHSVAGGIGAIVGGLPLTGLLLLVFRASRKGNDGSGVPRT